MATTRSARTTAKSKTQIQELRQKAETQEQRADQLVQEAPAKQDANTRQKLARYFVIGYFILFAIILVGYPVYNLAAYSIIHNLSLNIKLGDIIQTFSSVIGPALGFVIGYYFKASKD